MAAFGGANSASRAERERGNLDQNLHAWRRPKGVLCAADLVHWPYVAIIMS